MGEGMALRGWFLNVLFFTKENSSSPFLKKNKIIVTKYKKEKKSLILKEKSC